MCTMASSDMTIVPTSTTTLTQRLQSAEKSIAFIQREHSSTLANLHEEIAKWQLKCSDLTFKLAIGGGTVINANDDNKLRANIEQLENELRQCKDKIESLNRLLNEKETLIQESESRLLVRERQHAAELRLQHDKQRQLKIDLEQRSTLIAQLTSQLHREKQLQQQLNTRVRLGQLILPSKPVVVRSETEQQQSATRRMSNRSTSLNTRTSPEQDMTKVLFVGRRPPTPPQQLRPLSSKSTASIDSDEQKSYTKRQRQLLVSHAANLDLSKVAPGRPPPKLSTVLPPIVNRKIPLKAFAATALPREGEA